jgi:hypothetical protein
VVARTVALAALLALPGCGSGKDASSPSGPSAREQYVADLNRDLDDVIRQTASLPQQRLQFAANIMLAHEAWVEGVPQEALELYVDALREAGARRVDINLGLFPWLDRGTVRGDQTIAKYDAVVERIRSNGLQLAFNPQYSPTYHRLARFQEWQAAALDLYEEVARRYQPDIMVVVHEPTTMAARLGVPVTSDQWATFARRAAQTVTRVSPRTRCGAGGLAYEIEYFSPLAAIAEIDVMTLDIYDLGALPAYNLLIATARQQGKPVYIEETWRTPFATRGPGDSLDALALQGIGDRGFQSLDVKWLQALTQYAAAQSFESITAVWTQTFFKYVPAGGGNANDPAYTALVIEAVRNRERTDTFRVYRALAGRFGLP